MPSALYTFRRSREGEPAFPFVSAAFETLYGIAPADILENGLVVLSRIDPRDRPVVQAGGAGPAARPRVRCDLHLGFRWWHHLLESRRLAALPLGRVRGARPGRPLPLTDSVEAVRAELVERGQWSSTLEHRRKSGETLFVDCRMQLVPSQHGGVQVLESNRDVTDRIRAERVLATRTRALERANAELEQFSYVASHDLQEPLRGVIGCVELLQRRCSGQLDGRGEEYIRLTVEAAGRLQLIDDLLAYSRVRSDPVDLDQALSRALRNLTTAIQESGAVVTHDPLGLVEGDPPERGAVPPGHGEPQRGRLADDGRQDPDPLHQSGPTKRSGDAPATAGTRRRRTGWTPFIPTTAHAC